MADRSGAVAPPDAASGAAALPGLDLGRLAAYLDRTAPGLVAEGLATIRRQ
ncbi:hypothetical protein SAMN05443287_102277 [Micromonospora phaseoli]|uniref:Uncharacterized protein n=1 Tax=Micromonospora phaseoli TaxID=1144548 RepID=A0A1H6UWW5_9ACTN|nr:hypothetical protein [Micromonospora phaseoli]PZV99041.1 hypothetical protein CLV64_104278 [Micromonospora phaseoli]GIJ76205.1 hypothetical protein Xph01_06370 [Micromonospora phaseoli]SEI92452.1 hypothetical protein SAMN05443287_102277 [Micromonospora phaseoli]